MVRRWWSLTPSGTLFAQLAKSNAGRAHATKLLAVGDPLYDAPSVTGSLAARPSEGVQITQVEYSNGQSGGLEMGDVLLTFDGREILDMKQFRQVFEETAGKRKSTRPGETFRPSATVLREGKIRSFVQDSPFNRISFRNWTGFASPRVSLPRLPGTRREVQAIAALVSKAEATTLLGAAATEKAVQRMAASGELARIASSTSQPTGRSTGMWR